MQYNSIHPRLDKIPKEGQERKRLLKARIDQVSCYTFCVPYVTMLHGCVCYSTTSSALINYLYYFQWVFDITCTCVYTYMLYKDAKQAIILEDDLEVSPDFFR